MRRIVFLPNAAAAAVIYEVTPKKMEIVGI
jgi:hypothetical protein